MSLIERSIQVGYRLRVTFTEDVFAPANATLLNVLREDVRGPKPKALVVLDESLARAQSTLARRIEDYFAVHREELQLVCPPLVIEGGERTKNSYFHVSEIQSHVDRYHIDRHSYVIAIGGGALLDMVGLAASTAHRGAIARTQLVRSALQFFKELSIADQGDLHGFHVTGAFVARREGFEQSSVVDDCERWREGANKILFAERIDAVLHAHAGIALAQGRARQAHVPHAAMRGGRRQPHHVQERAPADGDHV